MARKPKSAVYRLGTTLLATVLVLYVGYQTFRSIFSDIHTEMAVIHSVYESIDTVGLVFRSETVIPASNSGYLYYTVENGTHVAKGSVIASVYSSEDDGILERKISEVEEQIEALRTIQNEEFASHLTLDTVKSQTLSLIRDLSLDISDGVFDDTAGTQSKLLSVLSKKQIITGEAPDFSATLQRLEQEKKDLKSRYHKAVSQIKAPVAGYFVDKADGYEQLLSGVDPAALTVSRLSELLANEPSAITSNSGKIVNGYEWYMGCVVPDSYYNTLSVGTSLTLRLSFVTDDAIPVTVAACNKDNAGSLAVVFRCANMSDALSTIRRESVQIQLVRHTGLKVPKRAVVINDDMQAGVYIRSGNTVVFRKIEQEYSEPADYVICRESDESNYLHLYDDIIVGGRGLYDGKLIR